MKVFDIRVILEILLKIWDVVQEMAGGATIVILLVLICRLFIRKVFSFLSALFVFKSTSSWWWHTLKKGPAKRCKTARR